MREPEFNDDDRARLFVDFEDEHKPRSSTGIPWDVASDPKNQGRFPVEVFVDHAAAAEAKKQEEYRKTYGKDFDLSSYRFVVGMPPDAN